MKIHAPSSPNHWLFTARTEDEAQTFVEGFCSALEVFAIHKNGRQVIGCMETEIKELKAQMRAQIPSWDAQSKTYLEKGAQ